MTNDDSTTTTCGNEYPGPRDIAEVRSHVTNQNVDQAYDFLMGLKVVALLLANQDENNAELDTMRLKDLGQLIFFLAEQPSDVLGELRSALPDDDPDPGQHKPVLVSMSKKQDAGGELGDAGKLASGQKD